MKLVTMVVLTALGLSFLIAGLLMPAHLRAVDAQLLAAAGRSTPSLVAQGLNLVKAGQIGPARMLLHVAKTNHLPLHENLALSLDKISDPGLLAWGGLAPKLNELFAKDSRLGQAVDKPFMTWLIPTEARERVLAHLQTSPRFEVREILRTRALTNLAHFTPVDTSTGQAFDAAILLAGLLVQSDDIAKPLQKSLETLAFAATKRGEVQPLELAYLDLVTLGNRLDWMQLTVLLQRVMDTETLTALANLSRTYPDEFPVIYTAAILSPSASSVVKFLLRFGKDGITDLNSSLVAGSGALAVLLERQTRIHNSGWRLHLAKHEPFHTAIMPFVKVTVQSMQLALALKYSLFVISGLFFARIVAAVLPTSAASPAGRLVTANQLMFLACFIMVLLALCEPFIFHWQRSLEFPLRWKFAMVGDGVRARTVERTNFMMMDTFTTLSLLIFLVIQSALYCICLAKISQIRRQPISNQLKLKLLENEEHMFDAGLYCGFGGTVASFLLLAMGVVKPSLMAAYSSTLFGIIFVAIVKICHLRPFRKTLILNSEAPSR